MSDAHLFLFPNHWPLDGSYVLCTVLMHGDLGLIRAGERASIGRGALTVKTINQNSLVILRPIQQNSSFWIQG